MTKTINALNELGTMQHKESIHIYVKNNQIWVIYIFIQVFLLSKYIYPYYCYISLPFQQCFTELEF